MKCNLIFVTMILISLVACFPAATMVPSSTPIPSTATTVPPSPTSAPTATIVPPTPTITPLPTSTLVLAPTAIPQPNVELRFFFDWNSQDPFNLQGTGLNSKKDAAEPILAGWVITHEGKNLTTDESGIVRFLLPGSTLTTTITIPNTNKNIGQKNLAALGLQYSMMLYEPNRVSYGPRFVIDLHDDNCLSTSGKISCDIGITDGYLTSPFKAENYFYSSPWTFDDSLNYEKDFVTALNNGLVPSPAGGMYQLGALGKLIASYANANNRGVPYGYPYLVKDPNLGLVSHLLMDVRNDLGVPIYAPVGGTVCKGNSSDFAICAGDVTIDINDIRAVPNWQYGLKVTRGQLIGWTDPANNITGQAKPFPLIHLGNFDHRDRASTLARFPHLTAEQIVMGAKPDQNGQLVLAPREQVIANYNYRVHLPHAPAHTER